MKEMKPFVSGEFLVTNIKRVKITDLFYSNGDKWYRCKVNLIIPDEDKGIERKSCGYDDGTSFRYVGGY